MNIYNKGFTYKLKENMSDSLSGKDKATYDFLINKKIDYLIALKRIDDEHMLVTELSRNEKQNFTEIFNNDTAYYVKCYHFKVVNNKCLTPSEIRLYDKYDFVSKIYNVFEKIKDYENNDPKAIEARKKFLKRFSYRKKQKFDHNQIDRNNTITSWAIKHPFRGF